LSQPGSLTPVAAVSIETAVTVHARTLGTATRTITNGIQIGTVIQTPNAVSTSIQIHNVAGDVNLLSRECAGFLTVWQDDHLTLSKSSVLQEMLMTK
jgi:hypothetical protein